MLSTFKYQVLALARDRILMLWACLFPIIMSCVFGAMFGSVGEEYAVGTFQLGVVTSEAYRSAPGLDAFLENVSAEDDEPFFVVQEFANEDDATAAVRKGQVDGYLTVDDTWWWDKDDWAPQLHVSPATNLNSEVRVSVARTILDAYVRMLAEYVEVGKSDMALLQSQDGQAAFFSDHVSTRELVLTKTPPDPSARYYYSLLGMATGMAAMLTIMAVKSCQATTSSLGARRTLAAEPRWRVLAGSLLASWVCSFAALVAAFAFMALVIGVDFGDNVGWCLLALAISSLMTCSAGALLGTVPGIQTGIVSGISCLLSLFTGLYGTAAQRIADAAEAAAPVLTQFNPLWQTANAFFSLLYYDTLDPFFARCLSLLAMTCVFAALAGVRMRRMSYEHL